MAALRDDRAPIGLDQLHGGVAILDFDAPMMNARAGAGELSFVHLFIVIEHEGDIQLAIGHVARYVAARMTGSGLTQSKYVLIEFGGALEILDLDSNMNDASHSLCTFGMRVANGRNLFGEAALRKHRLLRAVNVKARYVQLKSWLLRGIERMRFPVAAWIALQIAGATRGTTSSPMPEIQRLVLM